MKSVRILISFQRFLEGLLRTFVVQHEQSKTNEIARRMHWNSSTFQILFNYKNTANQVQELIRTAFVDIEEPSIQSPDVHLHLAGKSVVSSAQTIYLNTLCIPISNKLPKVDAINKDTHTHTN